MNADTIEQAAASWLTTVDPVTLQLATRYTQGGHWLLLWEALITIALSLLLVRSRIASRVAHRFERRGRSIVFCAFSVSGVVLLALSALALPWDFYVDWYRERQYGLTDSSPGAWFIERLIEAVLLALVLGLFFGLFLWPPARDPTPSFSLAGAADRGLHDRSPVDLPGCDRAAVQYFRACAARRRSRGRIGAGAPRWDPLRGDLCLRRVYAVESVHGER
jgi:hypothetical protein